MLWNLDITTTIKTHANDTENEDNYEIGLEWFKVDPGPYITAYSGFSQCLLDPMKNHPEANDTENEDNCEIGLEWFKVDPGPYITLYSGFSQCLLDPKKNYPEDFFNALFEDQMYTIMAEETIMHAEKYKEVSFFS